MKIAITADCHLSPNHPERKQALEKILEKLKFSNINILIIAGDLFDKKAQNYSEFDEILKKFPNIFVYAIPGNHDSNLHQKFFTAKTLKVISPDSEKKLKQFIH